MNITFEDNGLHAILAPLTLTRPVAELRLGITTISESWRNYFGDAHSYGYATESYLQDKFIALPHTELKIAGNIKANAHLFELISGLKNNTE